MLRAVTLFGAEAHQTPRCVHLRSRGFAQAFGASSLHWWSRSIAGVGISTWVPKAINVSSADNLSAGGMRLR